MIFNISLFLSMTDKYSYTTQRKFRNVYCICPSYGYLERKDVSQQRSVTANKFHSKEGSQQRNLTAKKPNSKEVSQQRSLTAKKPHSEEASQQTSFTAKKSHSKEASQQTSFTAKKSHRKEASQQRSPTAKKPHSKEASQQRSLTAKKSHSKEVSQQRSLARKLRFQKFQLQFLREAPHESFAFPSCSCKFRGKWFYNVYVYYILAAGVPRSGQEKLLPCQRKSLFFCDCACKSRWIVALRCGCTGSSMAIMVSCSLLLANRILELSRQGA